MSTPVTQQFIEQAYAQIEAGGVPPGVVVTLKDDDIHGFADLPNMVEIDYIETPEELRGRDVDLSAMMTNDMRRYIRLVEAAESSSDGLTAEPFAGVDPISRKPDTAFRIMRNGEALGVIAGRFAKTPDEALAVYRRRQDELAAAQRDAEAGAAEFHARRREPKPPPVESNFEIVDPESIDYGDEPDDFYYHVTSRPKQVLRNGLRPNRRPSMDDGFYRNYSAGKVFFCERPGVPYWLGRISDHLEAQFERPPKLSVVRFPKSLVNDAQKDELGTRDSYAGSYFVTHPIR